MDISGTDCWPFDGYGARTAIIFIGIQASGKSTFYQRYFADAGYVHINLDTLKTRSREAQLLDECLENGKSFVVDNTDPTVNDRARYIVPAKAHDYRVIGCYFRSSVSESIQRNAGRRRKVPTVAIAGTANRLELPSAAEGFDELWYISIGENGEFNIQEWKEDNA